MDIDAASLTVTDNQSAGRFEAQVGEHMAILEYRREGDRITYTHTLVPEPLEGHGVAGRLTQVALDAARAEHLSVIPQCSYVAAYIRRHPAYQNLVPLDTKHLLHQA